MFTKPISVKSNSKIKNSERKQLLDSFCTQYNKNLALLPDVLRSADAFRLKISTTIARRIHVYKFGDQPLIIEEDKKLIPTIFLLWLLPDLLPEFKIHESLIDKLASGADLMLPGLILDRPLRLDTFAHIEKNTMCCISTINNRAAVAVGHMAMSGLELFTSAGHGKAVIIYHVVGDHLCSLGTPVERPLLEWDTFADAWSSNQVTNEVATDRDSFSECPTINEKTCQIEASESLLDAPTLDEDLDTILRRCFLLALRSLSDTQLPMPVSVFYSQHVLPQKPSSIQLDIKKTSFKKVGTFLKVMEDDGLISLLQVKPGVYNLKSISRDHSSLQDVQPFVTDDSTGASSQKSWPPGYFGPPTIEDVRIVTGPTASFFAQFGFRPNTCITQSESRNAVNSYVREHGLLRQDDPNLVRLDDLLVKLCDPKLYTEAPESTLAQPVYVSRLDHILSSILQPMPVAYRITFPTEGTTPVLWRKPGKLPSIELSTAKKNGKRLTRITNLSVFGIDPDAFAKHLQLTLACSAGRVEDPQFPNSDIIRAQGWHDAAISKMLVETYGIKKQFINGYVEDPKKKRK